MKKEKHPPVDVPLAIIFGVSLEIFGKWLN